MVQKLLSLNDRELTKIYSADISDVGKRLDAVCAKLLPNTGLRGRRRFIAQQSILVNGKAASAALKIKAGDLIEIKDFPENSNIENVKFLGCQGNYCFYFKPAEMHCVALAGKGDQSLESFAAELYYNAIGKDGNPQLLQRLDFGTSGIVCAALDDKALTDFRTWEKQGLCHKYYLAILKGTLEHTVVADNRLDTANRKKTRILQESADPFRSTKFQPLKILDANGKNTLALCHIFSGQRHQIRAHAAAIGFPLAGDEMYGGGSGGYSLTHFLLKFPGHSMYFLQNDSLLGNLAENLNLPI